MRSRGDESFRIGDSSHVRAMQDAIDEFLDHVVPNDERPMVVTDDASVFDVTTLDPEEIIARCVNFYGRGPSIEQLSLPLWKLVALLRLSLNN